MLVPKPDTEVLRQIKEESVRAFALDFYEHLTALSEKVSPDNQLAFLAVRLHFVHFCEKWIRGGEFMEELTEALKRLGGEKCLKPCA